MAAGIGGRTVAEARKRLTAREVDGWRRFFAVNGLPYMPQIQNSGFSHLMLLVATAAGMKKRGGQAFNLDDFQLVKRHDVKRKKADGISLDDFKRAMS